MIPNFGEIRMRHTSTTKGEWHKCKEKNGLFSIKTNFDLVCENLIEEDAEFIANVKQDIENLIAENQRFKNMNIHKPQAMCNAVKKVLNELQCATMQEGRRYMGKGVLFVFDDCVNILQQVLAEVKNG